MTCFNSVPGQFNRFEIRALQYLLIAASCVFCAAINVSAATVTKADNIDSLNLGTSWVGNATPTSADVAVWDSTVTAANTVNLGASTNWSGIQILNPGGVVTITNASTTLTLGSSGIDTTGGSQNLILSCPVVIGAPQNWNLVTAVTLSGGLSGANNVTFSGGTLTLNGGTMTLSNLIVNAGTVSSSVGGVGIIGLNGGTFSVNGAINQGINVMAGGTEQNTGGNRTWSGNLTGSGPLTVIASSIHTWSGNNTNYTGTITLQGGGQLRLSTVNAVSSNTAYAFNGGTMTPNVANSLFHLGSLGGPGTLNTAAGQNFSIGALGTDTDFSGVIAGAGMIFKNGAGTLTLSGANTFTGPTTISNGVLQFDNGSGIGKPGTGTITNYSRLVFNRSGTLTVPNVITGPGSLTNIGSGKVALTGTNTYTGPTTLIAGQLAIGTASLVASDYTVRDSAILGAVVTSANATLTEGNVTFGNFCQYEFDLGAFGNPSGTVVSNTGTLTVNGNVGVNLVGTNFSLGTITLLRYANRAGAGSFVLGSVPSNVSATLNDDTVNKQVTLTITSVIVGIDMTFRWIGDSAGNWDIDNLGNQIWRVVGTGQITNYTEGAAVLFDESATGTTNINLTTFVNPSAVTVNNTNKTYTFGGIGSIVGATGVLKKGPGTLIVTNANSYSGMTEIQGGTLRIAGDVGTIGQFGVSNNSSLVIDRTTATNVLPNTFQFFGQITGTGNLTILGLDSTNSIVEMEISAATGNPYSGGTTISNSFVRLTPNPVSDGTHSAAKSTGLGSGTITFVGNSTLQLDQYGVGNNDAQNGNFAAPLSIPAGQVATFLTAGRMTVSSTLAGSGTLNLGVSYVRDVISGDFSGFTGQVNVNPSPNLTGNQYQIANAAGLPLAKVRLAANVTMGGQAPMANNSVVPIGELSGDEGSFIAVVGQTPRNATFSIGNLNTSSTFAGSIQSHALTKVGAGTLTLSGTNNTFTGTTTISNGVLALVANTAGNTEISNTALIRIVAPGVLDVSGRTDGTFPLGAGGANQTLQGDGTIRGNLVVGAAGTLAPGFSIGTLTVTNAVTLGGTAVFELNRAGTPNSDRLVAPSITAGGTLTVTNIGAGLQGGDSFQLFSTPVSGVFTTLNLQTSDPVNQLNYTWTNRLAIDGTIAVLTAVASVNTTPTNLLFQVDGGVLTLTWPADHIGWHLQAQTNSTAVGLNTNWVDVAGTSTTNRFDVPISTVNGSVFFRLTYP